MTEYDLTLKLASGTAVPLQKRVKQLEKEIDRVYKSGVNNNNTISNKRSTNLQRDLVDALNQLKEQQDNLEGELNSTTLYNRQAYQQLVDALDKATQGIGQINSLANSDKYQDIQSFNLSSSKVYQSSEYADQQQANDFVNSELGKEVKNIVLRSTTQSNRWNQSVDSGVVTYQKYQEYVSNNQYTREKITDLDSQVTDQRNNIQSQIDELSSRQDQIKGQDSLSVDDVNTLAGIREQLNNLSKSGKYLDELSNRLTQAQEAVTRTGEAIHAKTSIDNVTNNTDTKDTIKVLPSNDSIAGYIHNHHSFLIRQAVRTALIAGPYYVSQGSNARLTNFNNIAGAMYARGGGDNSIVNTLGNNKLGMDLSESSAYLGAYTRNTGKGNLSNKSISRLTNTWGALALTNGASNDTVVNLLGVAGLTNTQGLSASDSERLADAIQNSLTNSHTSAKADSQLKALSSMYQTAATSGKLTTNDQINIAGFQSMMSKTGSSWQGSAGAQAYSGLANVSNNANNQNQQLSLWLDNKNFTGYNQSGNMVALKTAQRAKSDPYLYKTPIGNLYRTARQQTSSKSGAIAVTTQNLVTLSGNSLSYEQANSLVKLYADGKFTRANVKKQTKGKGVNSKKYHKTGTSSIRSQQQAIQSSQIKASQSLDGLRRNLSSFVNSHPKIGAMGIIGGSALMGAGDGIINAAIEGGTMATMGAGIKSVAKSGLSVLSKMPKTGKVGTIVGIGVGIGTGLLLMSGNAKASTKDKDNKAKMTSTQSRTQSRTQNSQAYTPRKKSAKHKSILTSIKDGILHFLSELGVYRVKHKDVNASQKQLIKHLRMWFNEIYKKVKNAAKNGSSDSKTAGDVSNDGATKSKEYWLKKAKEVAKAMGVDISDSQLENLMKLIAGESNYDQTITQQIQDVNSANGDPAKGLLQMIQGTFNKYKVKGHDNILSGVDQLYAFFNIANWASYLYGHAGWSPSGPTRGYANGGLVTHATGGSMTGPIQGMCTSRESAPVSVLDLRALQTRYTTLNQANSVVHRVKRNAPKIKVKIDTSQAVQSRNKNDIIDSIINDTFNAWVNNSQQQIMLDYYSH
jgi:SLT domain-containing protein